MTRLLIFAQTGNASQALAALGDGVEVVEISGLAEVSAHDRAAVLVLSDGLCETGDLRSVHGRVTVLTDGVGASAASAQPALNTSSKCS